MKLRRGVMFLPLWTQMTISILIVCVASLLIISLVVGIHTWTHGKTLVQSKLQSAAAMYTARLRDDLRTATDQFMFAMRQQIVFDAIRSQNNANISISASSEIITQLGIFARSVVSKQTTEARGVFISDSSFNQVYSLVLSDDTASLSAVLASLQELSPILQPGFSVWDFNDADAIITAPVLTVPSKGTPFYSLSITVPISNTSPFEYGIEGYATLVLDADKLAQSVTSGQSDLFADSDYDLVVVLTENNMTGFRYAASNHDATVSRTSTFYPLSDFPAIQKMAALDESQTYQTTGNSWLNTNTLSNAKASVGCSRISFYSIEWVFCIEIPKSLAFSRVVSLRNKVIGLSIGMLGFVLLMVMPTGRIMTAPLYSIYSQMGNVQTQPPRPKPRVKKYFETAAWLVGIGSPWARPARQAQDETSTTFKVPQKIKPFGRRFYHDELDRLVEAYNGLVSELNNQYFYLEDQVKDRTMEAQEARIEAEKANAAKSQFIANITHELRTPLNGIMGMTSVTLSEDEIPKIRQALEVIVKSGRTLMKLLNELLAFSKSQVDMEPKLSDFTPSEIVDNLENMFEARPEADKLAVPLEFVRQREPSPLFDLQLRGDGHRISQICLHLMSNAIKFTSAGDKVEVRIQYLPEQSPRVNVAPYAGALHMSTMGTLEVAVIDSGKGIDEAQLASIFEPFVQGDDAFTKKYDGTGLGMSMCLQLATTIGASVGVWSTLNKGTVCMLEVPVLAVDQPASPSGLGEPEDEFSALTINRNGMLYTSTGTQGTVSRYTLDPAGAKRISFLSAVESLPESSGPGDLAGATTQHSAASILSEPSSSRVEVRARHSHGHGKKRSVVESFMGLLRHSQSSHPSLRRKSSSERSAVRNSAQRHSRSASATPECVGTEGGVLAPAAAPAAAPTALTPGAATPGATPGATPVVSQPVSVANSLGATASPRSSFYEQATQVRDDAKERFLEHEHPEYRVLVADDNALNLEIMVKMLKRLGIENVHTATDGEAVVQLVEKSIKLGFHYSVILMDLSMPRLNGFQATDIIRRNLGYPYPVVALTGYSDQRTRRLCDSASIQEILVKPVLRDALISVLVKYDAHDGSQVKL